MNKSDIKIGGVYVGKGNQRIAEVVDISTLFPSTDNVVCTPIECVRYKEAGRHKVETLEWFARMMEREWSLTG